MKLLIILITIFSYSLLADETLPKALQDKLLGTWVSDKEKTIKFNEENSILPPKQMEFLSQAAGYLKIEYIDNETTTEYQPKRTLILSGKKYEMDEYKESKKYKILGFTESSIIIQTIDKIFGKMIFTLQFEDDKTYWIYLSGNISKIHGREYFKKI